MDLKTFLQGVPLIERDAFAARCATSWGHLRNVGYGDKPCSPVLAVSIEQASLLAVRRWDLRPDDWHRIWPELIGAAGAPQVPAPADAEVKAA